VTAPAIEFHPTTQSEFNKVRSDSQTIRFRITRCAGRTMIDGDWFGANWELARSAWRQIQSAWNAECVAHPCQRGDCGGGRSCVIVTVAPGRENYWRSFLGELLSRREAWLLWDGREFSHQKTELESAA
jgi:hypothetical protein